MGLRHGVALDFPRQLASGSEHVLIPPRRFARRVPHVSMPVASIAIDFVASAAGSTLAAMSASQNASNVL